MKRVFLLTLSALTLSAATAQTALAGSPAPAAEEPPLVMPAQEPATWEGAYLGATFGTRAGGDMTYTPGATFPSLEPGQSYGLFAGYNFQNGNFVYGGELAYQKVNAPGFGALGFPAETFEYFLDAKLRGGVAMDNALLYGFAGYSGSAYSVVAPPATWNVSGVNFGIGIDIKAGSNMIIGAEYIVRNLSGATNIPGLTQDATIQELQLRVGWKF